MVESNGEKEGASEATVGNDAATSEATRGEVPERGSPPEGEDENRELWRGIGMALGAAALFGGVVPLLCTVPPFQLIPFLQVLGIIVACGVGVTQALWLVPMHRHLRQRGQDARIKGLWVGAALVLFLNGTCWGVMLTSLSHAKF